MVESPFLEEFKIHVDTTLGLNYLDLWQEVP